MEWYYWVAIALAWYGGAALAIRRYGYAPQVFSFDVAVDESKETAERDARIFTWVFSPVIAAVATIIVVGGLTAFAFLWPLTKFFKWFERVALRPKGTT